MPGQVGLVVRGDSKLVVDFCLRHARPGKAVLFRALRRIQAIIGRYRRWIVFEHVPRAENAIADWLANIARTIRGHACVTALCKGISCGGDPPCSPAVAALALGGDVDACVA